MIVLGLYFAIFTLISAGVGALINAGRHESKKWQNQSIWIGAGIAGFILTAAGLVSMAQQASVYGY